MLHFATRFIHLAVLDETNFLGIAAKALPATHESVLSDQPMRVPTHPAVIKQKNQHKFVTEESNVQTSHNFTNSYSYDDVTRYSITIKIWFLGFR